MGIYGIRFCVPAPNCSAESSKYVWGKMDESVEKSCWGVTLWAIVAVLAIVLIGSFVMGSETAVSTSTTLTTTG